MARKNSLGVETLAALGAERLAALLMELGEADGAIRKRLVLALAEGGGPESMIKAIDRRLKALAGARGEVPHERQKAYATELDGLRDAIAGSLASRDPAAAADRLGRLIRLAPSVSRRVYDSGGRVEAVFTAAVADLGAAWARIAEPDVEALAGEVLALIEADDQGVTHGLVERAAPALGETGLQALARLTAAALAQRGCAEPETEFDWPRMRLRRVLGDVADARGDVDAFIAARMAGDGRRDDAVEIAARLIRAGRGAEALEWLDRPARQPSGGHSHRRFEGEALRIAALDQLGRKAEAQDIRWRLFERTLDGDVLRAHLRALPDFEDDAALERAFAVAAGHPDVLAALAFLAAWPNLPAAARLTMERGEAMDGRNYPLLGAAADALEPGQPLAATLLRRRMIDSVLARAASTAYPHAARDLAACARMDAEVDWAVAARPSHADYLADLRQRHGRKTGFWSLVKG